MTLQTIATVLIALAAAGALIAWRSAPVLGFLVWTLNDIL